MNIIGHSTILDSEPLDEEQVLDNINEKLKIAGIIDWESHKDISIKWDFIDEGKATYVICNAAGTAQNKTRALIVSEKNYLIWEGLRAVLSALSAKLCLIAVTEEDLEIMEKLISQWKNDFVDLELVIVPSGIIATESEHLNKYVLKHLKSIGKIGAKEFFERNNVSTNIIQYNIETLVSISMYLRKKEPCSRLMYMCGEVPEQGFIEISADEDLFNLVQGVDYQGILIDGATGTFLFKGEAPRKFVNCCGGGTGNGEVKIYSSNNCTVDMAYILSMDLFKQSCGTCSLCREGLLQIHQFLDDIVNSKGKNGDLDTMEDILKCLKTCGNCDFGQGAANVLLMLLQHNQEEVLLHIDRRRCNALRCKSMFTVHIKGEICLGCGACKKVCKQNAIAGEEGFIHVIDSHSCNQCMACEECCPNHAVIRAGAVKPITPTAPVPVGTFTAPKRGLMRSRN